MVCLKQTEPRRKLLDLTWSAARHQDSETSPKRETVWVTLLSDRCPVHHANKSIIYELAMNWQICSMCSDWKKNPCVVRQIMESVNCAPASRLNDRIEVGGSNLECSCTPIQWKQPWVGKKLGHPDPIVKILVPFSRLSLSHLSD